MSRNRTEAEIRDSLHEGGVYLTFSGDPANPYCFAKIVVMSEGYMWVKLFHENYERMPEHPNPGHWTITQISISMFLAWGPPKFPIHVSDEPVTDGERMACRGDEDWVPPDARVDPGKI